ncbi:UDP-N-acetylglucosamine 2-epimerase [Kosmotoga pacifica]|uniref:UDP-N-acetylglucosamine 2-epimerase (non-hydrolyzing) n=2 Tax=Kosmotoga pacifica TaxID=1330330 RepID=A0A0G2ZDZ6_9BACT|nr:UDP-N-acetylglucosamine 2-epimerase [Kosmotoga pacifica]
MAPIYIALKRSNLKPVVIATAQHREMLDQVLELFRITPDYDLDIMKNRQSLSGLTSRLASALDEVFSSETFDFALVQGDTTSTFMGSLISFYHKVPVGHVEAGLRTMDIYNPFPEEANRRLTGTIATFHYAPTDKAMENLLREGIEKERIIVTGNTVIDALLWTLENKRKEVLEFRHTLGIEEGKYILLTMHRRENWGVPMREVMKAVKDILAEEPGLKLVFPVHLNPVVRKVVYEELKGHEQVILLDPLDYLPFVSLMEGAKLILTDSGGIQEEAPALGKPTLVLRKTTERPEAIEAGTAKLIGTEREKVVKETLKLLGSAEEYQKMAKAVNPFGNGKAAIRIVEHLKNELGV